MKKILWYMLAVVSVPVHAQSTLGALADFQKQYEAKPGDSEGSAVKVEKDAGAKTDKTTITQNSVCTEDNQSSMPLTFFSNLFLGEGMEVTPKPNWRELHLYVPKMISNCNHMLNWASHEGEYNGKKHYAMELKFSGCEAPVDGKCEYWVWKKADDGSHQKFKGTYKPTLQGFEACLRDSGVIDPNGKVNGRAIVATQFKHVQSGLNESRDLYFVSRGPESGPMGGKHGPFKIVDKCEHFEAIDPKVKALVSVEDEQRKLFEAEKTKMAACKYNEYAKVATFIEKYEGQASELVAVRDNLILEAAKKAAEKFEKGQFSEEDLQTMADFEKYIVMPKLEEARRLYLELPNYQGAELDQKKAELTKLMKEIGTLKSKPYFTGVHTRKLITSGRFEEADKLNTMILSIESYSRLGAKVGNGVLTPDVANARINNARQAFLNDLENEKEVYALKTGTLTGKEDQYRALAKSMRWNIETRTANFTEEIRDEYGRMQPGGYCYAYFRNTQKCIQDSMERAQELAALLKHYNKIDAERAQEYDKKADYYGKLEAEGRRYIAKENGEELPPEQQKAEEPKPADTTVPGKRDTQNGYSFDYNPNWQQQGGQQIQMPQQNPMNQNPLAGWQSGGYQMPQYQNPFQMGYNQGQMWNSGYQQQQQPFMGMQAYNGMGGYNAFGSYPQMGGGYSFNYGGSMGMQQPQMYGQMGGQMGFGLQGQQGYWGQPYQAYSMNSMYGRW